MFILYCLRRIIFTIYATLYSCIRFLVNAELREGARLNGIKFSLKEIMIAAWDVSEDY